VIVPAVPESEPMVSSFGIMVLPDVVVRQADPPMPSSVPPAEEIEPVMVAFSIEPALSESVPTTPTVITASAGGQRERAAIRGR
jgi:hypothetical protein